jgi:predicted TIM-barrel fold metal-dependent hydrolase
MSIAAFNATALALLLSLGGCNARDTEVTEPMVRLAAADPPGVDHHQHLFSPAAAALTPKSRIQRLIIGNRREEPITADDLIGMLDVAGIRRAVVLSEAFWFDSSSFDVAQPEQAVRAENDWTANEAAKYPDRLVAFCSFNPLADYALAEIEYCARDGRFVGVKLSFIMSGVDLSNSIHIERVRAVFQAANRYSLPLVAHVRPTGFRYGREQAATILDRLVTAAPDVTIQIAHLWGGEGFSESALEYYAAAVAAVHPAARNLYFDVAEVAFVAGRSAEDMAAVAQGIRRIGLDRILYGSDAALNGRLQPKESWALFRARVPLNAAEFREIARNVAPYLR